MQHGPLSLDISLDPFAYLRLDSCEQVDTRDPFEQQSLDPFERLSDVHDLIYQHLSGKEVKKVSKVSSNWYNNIGSSIICMKKIVLKFLIVSHVDPSPAEINAILASQRRYVNFEFSRPFFCNDPRSAESLKKFSSSIVDLKLSWAVGSVVDRIFDEPVAFPQLKSLEIGSDVSVKLMEKLFTKSQLKTLTLITITPQILHMVLAIPTLTAFKVLDLVGPVHYFQTATFPKSPSIRALTINGGLSIKLKILLHYLPNLELLYYSGRDIQEMAQYLEVVSSKGIHRKSIELIQVIDP